ncbi:hypothetical protein BCV70DRAFT_66783 [Testicularia cyperi]|uniref:Uncharacterized protein n=1 Tax=Testicularia cyperi TaxID=1882483 RepID=A0A317XG85_9BASI|nr:hypothetical protein BCV70DRAFT_66783 [Testicularia cyperi]
MSSLRLCGATIATLESRLECGVDCGDSASVLGEAFQYRAVQCKAASYSTVCCVPWHFDSWHVEGWAEYGKQARPRHARSCVFVSRREICTLCIYSISEKKRSKNIQMK